MEFPNHCRQRHPGGIRKNNRISLSLLALFSGLVSVHLGRYSTAAEWIFTPGLEISETYLDNVFLDPSGEEESDFITQINPELLLDAKGSRLELDLAYRMQNVLYARNSDSSTVFNQLEAGTKAKIVRDLFFVDADASFDQALISRTGKIGLDNNVSINDNTTDVWRYTISPYLRKRFGRFVSTELRYSYGEVNFSDASSSDSNNQRIFAWLGNNPANQRLALDYYRVEESSASRYSGLFDWSLIYDRRDSQAADDTDTKIEQAALDLGYRVGSRIALLATLGRENNRFEDESDDDRPGGFFWEVGAAWNPSIRTSLEARTGDRFFGQTYKLNLRYRTRRMTMNISYDEKPTNTSITITEDPSSLNQSSTPAPTTPGGDQSGRVPLPDVSTDVFVRKRFTADISRVTAKSIFRIGAFNEERDYRSVGDDEQDYGVDASWDWKITQRMTSRLVGDWFRQELRDGNNEDLWQVSLRLTRQFSLNADGFLELRHGNRDSNIAENNYEQNQIQVGFRIQFGRSQLRRSNASPRIQF